MKSILFIISILLFSGFIGFSQDKLIVDPNAQLRNISGYNSIKVSDGIDVYLTQSDSEAVAVSAAETKHIDRIKTVVEKNTLRIFFDNDNILNFRNRKLKVYVSFKELQLLDVSGASDVHVVSGFIKTPHLTIRISGASDFNGSVSVNKLDLDLSGASDVNIKGSAEDVSINSSGASDVDGFGLVADKCTVNASGASDVNIEIKKELSVNLSGSSEVSYKGSPELKNIIKSGSSSVSRKG